MSIYDKGKSKIYLDLNPAALQQLKLYQYRKLNATEIIAIEELKNWAKNQKDSGQELAFQMQV